VSTVKEVKEQIDGLIGAHCEANAEYRNQRFRVTMAEVSGQPDPQTVVSVEESLSKVYGLLYEASERLAAVAAALEFNERGTDG
jgi:hypothetical protein